MNESFCLKVIVLLVENHYFLYFVVSIRMVRMLKRQKECLAVMKEE